MNHQQRQVLHNTARRQQASADHSLEKDRALLHPFSVCLSGAIINHRKRTGIGLDDAQEQLAMTCSHFSQKSMLLYVVSDSKGHL
jgi:hypothetical protein